MSSPGLVEPIDPIVQRREELRQIGQDFKIAFGGEQGMRVLDRLSGFCRENKTTHVIGDTHGSAQLEGRRQVMLMIRENMRLTSSDIEVALYAEMGDD